MKYLFDAFYEETSAELDTLEASNGKRELRTVYQKINASIDKHFSTELKRSGSKIACCTGCFYCCHLKVDIFPGEAFLIASFIRDRFSEKQRDSVLQKAKENWGKVKHMSHKEQFSANLACPLLENGCCTIYPVRPGFCRRHHSTSVELCKESFERPDLLDGPESVVPIVNESTACAIIGSKQAIEAKGYDANAYDINGALIECLTNKHSEKRWRHGKSSFPRSMLAKEPSAPPN